MDVKVLGAAMTPFGRHAGADLRSLAVAATTAALGDAGLGPADVGMVVFGNATDGILHGQEMIRGEVALRHAGFRGVPIVNVENACASSSTALHVACLAVEAGAVDVALAVGVEKLTHAVKARSFTAIATAVDLDEDPAVRRMVAGTLLGQSAGDEPVVESSPLMVRYDSRRPPVFEVRRSGLTARHRGTTRRYRRSYRSESSGANRTEPLPEYRIYREKTS